LRKNKFFIFLLFSFIFLLFPLVSFSQTEVRIQTSERTFANTPVGIIVFVRYPAVNVYLDVELNYGDGTSEISTCVIGPYSVRRECSVSFSHTYSNSGNYTITASVRLTDTGAVVGSDSFSIQVEEWNPPSPPPSPPGTGGSGSGISSITDINPISATTFGEILDRIATALFFMAIFITPFLIAVGGFLMSSGIPSRIIMGKRIILIASAIFGVVALFKLVTSLTVDIIK